MKSYLDRIAGFSSSVLRRIRVATSIRHVSGQKEIALSSHQVAVVCLIRDGAYYVKKLLSHHRELGVEHFLFIDNGSVDGTVEMLTAEPDVTVVQTLVDVSRNECLIRACAARRYIKGGWFLFVDSDELIEFPTGQWRKFTDAAQYCNDRGFNAVVSQMLDLFSDLPLCETESLSYEASVSRLNRYSLDFIETFDYHSNDIHFAHYLANNKVPNGQIGFKFGGIRRELFGEHCALTKHSLVKNEQHIGLYSHPHCSSNVSCADFTMLVRHYKFAGPFFLRQLREIERQAWLHGEDKKRAAVIQSKNFCFRPASCQILHANEQLVAEGFLVASLSRQTARQQ